MSGDQAIGGWGAVETSGNYVCMNVYIYIQYYIHTWFAESEYYTQNKNNMSPKKGPFQKESRLPATIFQGIC